MSFREELLFDFAEHIPRVLVCGNVTVVDNVKGIEIYPVDSVRQAINIILGGNR